MAHRQHPLGSGFTASSTAAEVVAGIDLTGKNFIITGGHTGIGREATAALANAGASVTVGARHPQRAAVAVDGMDGVEVSHIDLVDPPSIDAFVARWLDSGRPLHGLINCAGVAASETVQRDARGYEMQFAANHLGHFQLTLGLLPALRAARNARVVNVTSGAHRFGRIRWEDPHFSHDYDPMAAYAQSKLANVLFAVELDRRWAGDGIRGYAVHPGVVVGTALNSAVGEQSLREQGLIDAAGKPIIDPERGKKSPQQGAATIVFAATSPLLADLGGVYCKDNDVSELDAGDKPLTAESIPSDVAPHAIDHQSARQLWDLSEQLVGRREVL